VKSLALVVAAAWAGLWFTPDQQGQRHFRRGEFAQAAEDFRDPHWQGAAWYRAGAFEESARAYARCDTAEAHYNQGNARVMLGTYDLAIACYDRALAMRPGWKEAADNRALAKARARALAVDPGDSVGGMVEADGIAFDKKVPPGGQTAEVAGGEPLSDQEIQALWLRRVQTRPADFLKAKFAHQQALRTEEEAR